MLLMLFYEAPFDWASTRKSLFDAKSPDEKLAVARLIVDHCLGPAGSPAARSEAENGARTLISSVFSKEDDGVSVTLVRYVGEAALASQLLKLAWQACANYADLQKNIAGEIRSLKDEPSADAFVAECVQKFDDLINLQNLVPGKTETVASANPTSATPAPSQEPIVSAPSPEPVISSPIPSPVEKPTTEKTIPDPLVREKALSVPPTFEPEKEKTKIAEPTSSAPAAAQTTGALKGEETKPPTAETKSLREEAKPSVNEGKISEGGTSPLVEDPTPYARIVPGIDWSLGLWNGFSIFPADPSPVQPPLNPADSPSLVVPIVPAELKEFDILHAQALLQPVHDPTAVLSEADYLARQKAASGLAALSHLSNDGETALRYGKWILDAAAGLDQNGIDVVLSVRAEDKRTTMVRLLQMYNLAFECVRKYPEQTIALLHYIDQSYSNAANTRLDTPSQGRLQMIHYCLPIFCLGVLESSAKSPVPGQRPGENPALYGAILNTLVVSGSLGTLGTGELLANKEARVLIGEARLKLLDDLQKNLLSPNADVSILSARALRVWGYDSQEQKRQSIGLMLNALRSKTGWTLPQSRALLEEAIRLDLNPEWTAEYSQRLFNHSDSTQPAVFSKWISERPELLLHALMVSGGFLAPIDSFAPAAPRPASGPALASPDPTATLRWMGLLQAPVRRLLLASDEKSLSDHSASAGYPSPYSDLSMVVLYLQLLRGIKDDNARFGTALSARARQNYNELNKISK